MKIEKTIQNKVLIVRIQGRLDGDTPSKLREMIPRWLEIRPNIILDCHKLEYIDSSGLGAFLSCLRKAVALGGDVRIASPLPAVTMVFELTRTQQVFKIFDTLPQALASFDFPENVGETPSEDPINPKT